MTAQFLEISGEQMVLLSHQEFARLTDAAAHYDDIVAAVEAQKLREAGGEYIPAEIVAKLVDGESPLRVWRQYRGLTLQALADRVGRKAACISKLELGQMEGGIKLWQSLASALNVDLDDLIVPEI